MNFKYVPAYVSMLVATLFLAACAEAPIPVEQQFIDDVAAAMGGKENIEAARTLNVTGAGSMQNLGQDMTPESTDLKFDVSNFGLAMDLDSGNSRTEQTRTPQFIYFRGQDPMRQVFGLDGDIAYTISADGTGQRAPDSVALEQRSTYYHHPLPLLKAALQRTAVVSNVRNEDGLTLADFMTDEGIALTMGTDPATSVPAFIRSTDHHFYLRDVIRQTNVSNYVSVDGLVLPSQVDVTLDEFTLINLQLTAQEVNGSVGDLDAPVEATAASPISGSAPANVSVETLADGVWFLAGQSHHSVLIEFGDHLMAIEAPNEIRTLGVLEMAEELVPGKPVRYLVNTHHHFDHSGGIRTAASAGLTIVTHAANESFYRRMAEQPSSLVPDTQSRQPRAIEIETVTDAKTYADDSMTVELHHVAGNPHSSSMLMIYLPEQRLIIEADAYNPNPSRPARFAPNLLDNIQRLGLDIDRIVPIHGGVTDFAELEDHVQGLRDQQ